jgi:membrane-bound acyltransferase YfiQ involved in biofilm formation
MKRHRKYLIALGVVALWAVFSWAYLGVEDGSSGLSPLGWLAAVFFVPGGLLLQAVKGSHANADLPLMAAFSFCVYAVLAVLVVKGFELLRH